MEATTPVTSSASNQRDLIAGAHHAVDRIADVANHAVDTISDKRARLRAARSNLMQDCRSYVNENPAATVGVAVAAGFLLRHLIRPR